MYSYSDMRPVSLDIEQYDPEEGNQYSDPEETTTATITTQPTVTINYKFHDKLYSGEPTPIEIPQELFEGPSFRCQELFLKDLREDVPQMDVRPRQLQFWAPTYPLEMKNTMENTWENSVAFEHDFKKIFRPLSLSSQISWKDKNLVHLVVSINGQWSANRPMKADTSNEEALKAVTVFVSLVGALMIVGTLCAKYLELGK